MDKSKRIAITKTPQFLEIEIYPHLSKNKLNLLLAWLILWSAGGIIIISQFFSNHDRNTKLFMLVWLAFWAYYEYKAITAYRWKKFGRELITIDHEKITIVNEVKGRGVPFIVKARELKDIRTIDFKSKEFSVVMSNSFWSMGGETILFNYSGKSYGFGKQLTEEEALPLLKNIKSFLKIK